MGWEAPMREQFYRFCSEERGQDLIEYTLLLAFIALAGFGFMAMGREQMQGIAAAGSNRLAEANAAANPAY